MSNTKTRTRFLAAGRQLMFRYGFSSMSINQLLQTANASRGAFYYHFKSKEGLGLEMLQESFDVCFSGLSMLMHGEADSPGDSHIDQWIKELLTQPCDRLRLIAQLNAEAEYLPEEMQAALTVHTERTLALLVRYIELLPAQRRLTGCSTGQLANMLYSLWLGTALLSRAQESPEAMKAAMVATMSILSVTAGATPF
ncbi:TetR/AcrR family transcriptional regulator [Pseudomonas sp. C11]|uniref:TetR/AcrR family transcriptional regulator n=1 Tax=Pseudomonas sp. C11 TaxID=3075550 RepID=UPI002AFDED0D|nr:TetR/AcrR family transcriptional regulator [Pseudomonas sp. C11]